MTHHQNKTKTARSTCRAHSCRPRAVVVVHVILVGELGVMVVVLIGRHTVGAVLVAIFCRDFSVTGDVLFTHPVGNSELC